MFLSQSFNRIGVLVIAVTAVLVHGCANVLPPLDDGLASGPTNASRNASIGDVAAMSDDEIRRLLLIDTASLLDRRVASPSSGFLTPSAYGADSRDAYFGVAGVASGNNSDVDGSSSLGVGFGNAADNIGVEVNAGIISLRDEFGEDGSIGVKLHRYFADAGDLAVAVGWSNAVKWGAAENAEDTFYGVVTKRFDLRAGGDNPLPLTASIGAGTGSFRSQSAIDDDENTANLFGSLSLRVLPQVSLISSWTGRSLGVAASAAPFKLPLVLTVGVSDATDRTADGSRFQGSLGYSINF